MSLNALAVIFKLNCINDSAYFVNCISEREAAVVRIRGVPKKNLGILNIGTFVPTHMYITIIREKLSNLTPDIHDRI